MYRIFKSLFVSFLFIFTLISNFGCSSSKSVKIKYTVNVIKENEEEAKMHNLGMSVVLNKKFRESIDTPCYEKIITTYTFDSDFSQVTFGENNKLLVYDNTIEINDKIYRVDLENKVLKYNDEKIVIKNNKFEITKYELMKNSEGVSKCYNSVGEEFERATLNKVDKIELSKENPLVKNNNTNHFESTLQEIPIKQQAFEFRASYKSDNLACIAILGSDTSTPYHYTLWAFYFARQLIFRVFHF